MQVNTKNPALKLLLPAFLGFQTACLFFMVFGELRWENLSANGFVSFVYNIVILALSITIITGLIQK